MSSWGVIAPPEEKPVRRVREEVRDGVAVVVVSAVVSTGLAVLLTLVTRFAG
jgi:hypothetical protein